MPSLKRHAEAPVLAHVVARTGFTIAAVDAVWAVVLTAAYRGSQARLWQGVASVPFGKSMLTAGAPGVLAGLGVHVSVAFFWSAVFVVALTQSRRVRSITATTGGIVLVSALYGPTIWVVMSRVLIPLATGNPAAAVSTRWWFQLAGHAPFVGLPIVWTAARRMRA